MDVMPPMPRQVTKFGVELTAMALPLRPWTTLRERNHHITYVGIYPPRAFDGSSCKTWLLKSPDILQLLSLFFSQKPSNHPLTHFLAHTFTHSISFVLWKLSTGGTCTLSDGEEVKNTLEIFLMKSTIFLWLGSIRWSTEQAELEKEKLVTLDSLNLDEKET